jgi:hypothetical protein
MTRNARDAGKTKNSRFSLRYGEPLPWSEEREFFVPLTQHSFVC